MSRSTSPRPSSWRRCSRSLGLPSSERAQGTRSSWRVQSKGWRCDDVIGFVRPQACKRARVEHQSIKHDPFPPPKSTAQTQSNFIQKYVSTQTSRLPSSLPSSASQAASTSGANTSSTHALPTSALFSPTSAFTYARRISAWMNRLCWSLARGIVEPEKGRTRDGRASRAERSASVEVCRRSWRISWGSVQLG